MPSTTADPAEIVIICPACRMRLWRQRRGEWSLATPMLKFKDGQFFARCPRAGCHCNVPVPHLVLRAVDPPPEPVHRRRYVVRLDKCDSP